jgi:hypothetical protein
MSTEEQSKTATTDAPMSMYAGYFCFQNMFGQDIVTGTAKHWTTDWGTETLTLDGLASGDQSVSLAFKTSSSNIDRWAFSVTLLNGKKYSVDEKDCGFESEDSGKTVILQAVVSGTDRTFNVIMPESSSCDCSF